MGGRLLLGCAFVVAAGMGVEPSSHPDWSRLAMDIHTETNLARSDPAGYAAHLEAWLPRFDTRVPSGLPPHEG